MGEVMKRYARWLALSLAMLPLAAAADVYKCKSPGGKVTYTGQMSMEKGVKCEPMFVKKPPLSQMDAPPAPAVPAEGASVPPPAVTPAQAAPAAAPVSPAPQAATQPSAPQKTPADIELEAKRKQQESLEAKKKAEDKAAEQKQKEENCKNAQANLRIYQMGGRVTRVNEKGEKIYLDDNEIKQKLGEAQQEVNRWCGGS
jgi:hypothetical protein